MRLGTRWSVGGDVPAGLPESVIRAICTVEGELKSPHLSGNSLCWTLTWLEDQPIVDLDDGTKIHHNRDDDSVTIERDYADFS